MKNVLIFGAGERGKKVVDENLIYSKHNKILAIIDNHSQLSCYKGIPIISPQEIDSYNYDEIWVCTIYYEEVRKQLIEDCGVNEKSIVYIEPVMHILEERIHEKYSDTKECSIPDELASVLEYIKGNRVRMYCYPFYDEYIHNSPIVIFDTDKKMYYTLYKSKKLYFSKKLDTEQKVKAYFNSISMEQDERSPHCYWNNCISAENGVYVDVGAAEGIFALDVVEKAEHVYIIEVDEAWIEALKCTFAPFEDKVTIVSTYISDTDGENSSKLDSIFAKEKIDYIKMDIEGEELKALQGCEILLHNNDIKLAVCVYHHQKDNHVIGKWLQNQGYQVENSCGYVLCQGDWELERDETDFRKGLIFAKKQI